MTIEVKVGKYKVASNEEVFFTKNLAGCIGLALAEPTRTNISLRGLSHIHHSDFPKDEAREFQEASRLLEDFLSNFSECPKAYISYVPCRYTQQGYQNPMFEFVSRILCEKNISLVGIDNIRIYGEDRAVIDFKEMIFKKDRIITLYRQMGGRWLNYDLKQGVSSLCSTQS